MAKKLISYDDEAEGLGLPDVVEQKLDVRYSGQGGVVTIPSPAVPAGFVPLRARLPLANSAPVVIVFAGSSTTQGGGVGGSNSFPKLLAGDHPYIQENKAENITAPFNNGITVVNMAMGGGVRYSYISEYEGPIVGGWNPTLVFHAVGSNDSTSVMDPAGLAEVIGSRIDAIDSAATLPVGHVIMHQHTRNDGGHKTPWDSFLPGLYGLENTRDNVTVVDLSAAFKAVGIPGDDPLGLLMADNFHVNVAGQKFYAELLQPMFDLPEATSLDSEPNPEPDPSAQVLFDDFERADGPLAGTSPTEGDQVWVSALGDWHIEGGRVYPNGASATSLVDTGVTNYDLTVDYYRGTNSGSLVLYSDGTYREMLTLEWATNAVSIRSYSDGGVTFIGTRPLPSEENQTHKLGVRVRGQEVTMYHGDRVAEKLTVEGFGANHSFVGIRGSVGDSSFDNLRITTPG